MASTLWHYLLNATSNRMNYVDEYLEYLLEHKDYHPRLRNDTNFDRLGRLIVLMSIDVEWGEINHSVPTEIEITMYNLFKPAVSRNQELITVHLII